MPTCLPCRPSCPASRIRAPSASCPEAAATALHPQLPLPEAASGCPAASQRSTEGCPVLRRAQHRDWLAVARVWYSLIYKPQDPPGTALRGSSSPALCVCSAPGVRPVRDRVGFGEERLACLVVKPLVANVADLIHCMARRARGSETGRCTVLHQVCSQWCAEGNRPATRLKTPTGVALDSQQRCSCT